MLSLRILALVLLCAASARAGELSGTAVRAAAAYSEARTGLGMLVIQHGKTLFSADARSAHRIYSGTKGFWIFAALAAAQEGIIDFDDRVAETIPEWQGSERKARVTVRHLLSMTSGLEPLFGLHENSFADRTRAAVGAEMVAEPGSRFIYGPAGLQVFHEYFRRKLAARKETPTHYLERRVLKPLGLGSQRYLADKTGAPLLATGFMLSPNQWAHEGQLILGGGKPILSGSSLAKCFHGSGANGAFGMGFWTNQNAPGGREVDIETQLSRKWYDQGWDNVCLCRDAPSDLVVALGSGGQRLYVSPSLDLVAVRMGNFGTFSDGTFLRLLLGK